MLPLRHRCASYTSHYIRRTFVCDGTSMVDHFIQKVVEEKVRLAPIRPLVQNRLAASYHTVGLRSDGTVVAAGSNEDGVFSGFKCKQIKARLAEIEKELEKL